MGRVIEFERVTKRYGEVVAVSDVSFALGPGVTGLLGPNGAGKTTLLKMMVGLLEPTAGQVKLFGQSLRRKPELYRRLGYCPEAESLYDFMTGGEFLLMNAQLQGLNDPHRAAQRALEHVDLLQEEDKRIRAYSRGMRQRLKVAQSLLHDPDVLLLDEPLKGADPTQRRILIDLIRRLGKEGKTIVLSSHVLYEVERMGAQIILLHHGRLLALGDFHAIRESMDGRPQRVCLRASDPKRLASLLTGRALVRGVSLSEDELVVDVDEPAVFYSQLPQAVLEAGVSVTRVVSLDEDLESVFRYLVP
jgi:ABC-2 type transport system ATP-binding protein